MRRVILHLLTKREVHCRWGGGGGLGQKSGGLGGGGFGGLDGGNIGGGLGDGGEFGGGGGDQKEEE